MVHSHTELLERLIEIKSALAAFGGSSGDAF